MRSFPFQNYPKNLDPSYKMDLDFLDWFRREISISEPNFVTLITVKILKFGTPQTIAIIVLKIEKLAVTMH